MQNMQGCFGGFSEKKRGGNGDPSTKSVRKVGRELLFLLGLLIRTWELHGSSHTMQPLVDVSPETRNRCILPAQLEGAELALTSCDSGSSECDSRNRHPLGGYSASSP